MPKEAPNKAILQLPAGWGFKISSAGTAGVRNYATLELRRNNVTTSLGIVDQNAAERTVRAVIADAEIIIAGYAENSVPSTLLDFGDGPLERLLTLQFNDAFANDDDYNDLIIFLKRFQAFDAGAGLCAQLGSHIDPLAQMALHPKLDQVEAIINRLDAGEPIHAQDYSDLPVIADVLNPEEKKLFDKDPVAGGRVFLGARSATSAAVDLYANHTLYNGNGDAFRHMYWNFLMTRSIGEQVASDWATAHESPPDNVPLEKAMDLYNNQIGRRLGLTNVDDNPRDLRASIRQGTCRIIQGGALVRSDSDGEL